MDPFCEAVCPFWSLRGVINCLYLEKLSVSLLSKGKEKQFVPDLLTACASTNPLLALENNCQDLLKTRSEKLTLKRRGQGYFLWLTLLLMHLLELLASTSHAKFMGGEHLNELRKGIY